MPGTSGIGVAIDRLPAAGAAAFDQPTRRRRTNASIASPAPINASVDDSGTLLALNVTSPMDRADESPTEPASTTPNAIVCVPAASASDQVAQPVSRRPGAVHQAVMRAARRGRA